MDILDILLIVSFVSVCIFYNLGCYDVPKNIDDGGWKNNVSKKDLPRKNPFSSFLRFN